MMTIVTITRSLLVLRDRITPAWIGRSDRFWYRVTTRRGIELGSQLSLGCALRVIGASCDSILPLGATCEQSCRSGST